MKLDTYHRYAQLFDAFAVIVGDGGHCHDITLFDAEAGPALREWAATRSLDAIAEEHECDGIGKWTRLEVLIGRHASIRVHLDVNPAPAPQPEIEPEIAF